MKGGAQNGASPVKGAVNVDNSPSVFLGHHKIICAVLSSLGLLSEKNKKFISIVREHNIIQGNAQALPFSEGSVDVLYTCHMAEHLYEEEFIKFLAEAERVLKPGGILRIAVPDLAVLVNTYNQDGDADEFCKSLHLSHYPKISGLQWLNLLVFGDRSKHKWGYAARSMTRFIEEHTNLKVTELKAGETTINFPTGINYREREEESLYVECVK